MSRPATWSCLASLLVCPAATPAVAQAPGQPQAVESRQVIPPAMEVAAALQQRLAGMKDFTASFTQTEEGGVLRRKTVEKGTVYIKKPGKMRWEYESPKKLFVSDGRTLFMYFPADRQVMKHPVPQQDEATSALLFLLGKGDVTRDFAVKYADSGTGETYALRLEPRMRQAEFDWLEIAVDRQTLQIKSLTAGTAQGGRSTFAFSNFRENTGAPDKLFQFDIPRGTEVISGK